MVVAEADLRISHPARGQQAQERARCLILPPEPGVDEVVMAVAEEEEVVA